MKHPKSESVKKHKRDRSMLDMFDMSVASDEAFVKLITTFMSMDVDTVFYNFRRLSKDHTEGAQYLYIPGTLPESERILFVAHADTVWLDGGYGTQMKGGSYTSWGKGKGKSAASFRVYGNIITGGYSSGCGADDRAGCAMLWALRNTGHSLLITDGEEVGCIGASEAAGAIPELLGQHNFAVEIDRRGDKEYVFYNGTHTPDFRAYMTRLAGDWDQDMGSVTDIAVICPRAGICGVNLAAGYMNEHTSSEIMFVDAWLRTLDLILLMIEQNEGVKYELPEPVVRKDGHKSKDWGAWGDEPHWWESSFTGVGSPVDICLSCGDEIDMETLLEREDVGNSYTSSWGDQKDDWKYELCADCAPEWVLWGDDWDDLFEPGPHEEEEEEVSVSD